MSPHKFTGYPFGCIPKNMKCICFLVMQVNCIFTLPFSTHKLHRLLIKSWSKYTSMKIKILQKATSYCNNPPCPQNNYNSSIATTRLRQIGRNGNKLQKTSSERWERKVLQGLAVFNCGLLNHTSKGLFWCGERFKYACIMLRRANSSFL